MPRKSTTRRSDAGCDPFQADDPALCAAGSATIGSLWPINEGAEDIAATLTHGAIGSQVHAVVAPASGSEDLVRAFRLARGALELGGSQAPLVRTIQDLGVVGLLLQLEDHRAVASFSDRVLGALRQSDLERSTDLILTPERFALAVLSCVGVTLRSAHGRNHHVQPRHPPRGSRRRAVDRPARGTVATPRSSRRRC